jgi:hypothetical protein
MPREKFGSSSTKTIDEWVGDEGVNTTTTTRHAHWGADLTTHRTDINIQLILYSFRIE